MEVKKLFALASVTALTGFVATSMTAACSSTEVVTIPNEAGASSSGSSGTVKPKTDAKAQKPAGDDDDVVGDDDDTTGDDDDTAAPTCLSKDPIDQTQYPYTRVAPGQKGACTTKELSDFSAYYKAHATEDTLIDTWGTSVSAKCASCIFTDDTGNTPATSWGPMVIGADAQGAKTFSVNRGGCVEAAAAKDTGSAAKGLECGKSYQQFQDCLLDACLKDCKTQTEFTACRQDASVLTTSCKGAVDALKTDCGETKVGGYETACKGTTYTFEGPIKQICITGNGGVETDGGVVKDSGAADAKADAKTP